MVVAAVAVVAATLAIMVVTTLAIMVAAVAGVFLLRFIISILNLRGKRRIILWVVGRLQSGCQRGIHGHLSSKKSIGITISKICPGGQQLIHNLLIPIERRQVQRRLLSVLVVMGDPPLVWIEQAPEETSGACMWFVPFKRITDTDRSARNYFLTMMVSATPSVDMNRMVAPSSMSSMEPTEAEVVTSYSS